MQTTTLFYIVLALLFSVAIAFFQYFYKVKNNPKINILLFALKALSLFVLSLLLLNPKVETQQTKNIKPVLSILVDNSLSTKHFKQEKTTTDAISLLKQNTALTNKFDINFFSFGKNTQVLDSLSFTKNHTNITQAINAVNKLNKNILGGIILLSDGNQTIGKDYEFINSKQAVFPLVLGDTTQYKDVRISQLNVNKYSYIKNKFPVETLLFYEGKESVNTQFSIFYKGKTIFTKKISFTSKSNTQTVIANLSSTQEGLQYYTASVKKLKDEKNTKNNTKNFSVEVIDQQTKVLILSSILHPDLGALKKAIESNKQRQVDVNLVTNFKNKLSDYQLVVFYQPNKNFKNYISERKSNYIIVSGTKTDWNFLNIAQQNFSKKAINQSENYQAVYSDSFLTFLQKNIGFEDFPPLRDKFGEITLYNNSQILLQQKVVGITSKEPLMVFFEENENKSAAILGENLWQWRAASFRTNNTFEDFDAFLSNTIQYLASNKKRKRLEVNAKSLYPANSTINIAAFYTDKNYQFDNRASLQITVTNAVTKEHTTIPFSLVNNTYQVDLDNLSAGNYRYKVSVASENENINSYGRFKITDYQVEEQFTNANKGKLQKLADRTGGKLFYANQQQELVKELVNNKTFYTTQKSTKKEQNLIDWKWILFLAVILLALEWFIRKYYGKI